MLAKAIELALSRMGASVTSFSDAEEALASSAAEAADFYISDYLLPGRMHGLQLLEALQRRSAGRIRAVLITGAMSLQQRKSLASSGWTVLLKPVDLHALMQAM